MKKKKKPTKQTNKTKTKNIYASGLMNKTLSLSLIPTFNKDLLAKLREKSPLPLVDILRYRQS